MYDPARDIFTSSEDAPVDPDDEPIERRNGIKAQQQGEHPAQSMPNTSNNLREHSNTVSNMGVSERFVNFASRYLTGGVTECNATGRRTSSR